MAKTGNERRCAWRAALACMVTLAVAMGLGRFAFTPMLPVMLHEGKLDLQASERESNHIRGRDGDPFKLRLCSDSPDPLMLFRG